MLGRVELRKPTGRKYLRDILRGRTNMEVGRWRGALGCRDEVGRSGGGAGGPEGRAGVELRLEAGAGLGGED